MDGGAAPSQGAGHFCAPVSPRRQGRLPERPAAGNGIFARRLRALYRPQAAAEPARRAGAARQPGGVHVLKAMNLKKSLHHGGHEDSSWSCRILGVYQQSNSSFWSNTLSFFAAFVLFVVTVRNSG